MSCTCVISAYGDDRVEEIEQIIRKARKPHKCIECREMIAIGEHYESFFGTFDGEAYRYHTCLPCTEIREFFSCDGSWMWGSVWHDLYEHLFDNFHYGCIEPKEDDEPLSAAAKAKVVAAWRKWKGF